MLLEEQGDPPPITALHRLSEVCIRPGNIGVAKSPGRSATRYWRILKLSSGVRSTVARTIADFSAYAKIARLLNEKKYRAMLRKLRRLPELSEHEAILFARSLAATPDQRWEMNANFLRSLGFSTLSAKRKLISK